MSSPPPSNSLPNAVSRPSSPTNSTASHDDVEQTLDAGTLGALVAEVVRSKYYLGNPSIRSTKFIKWLLYKTISQLTLTPSRTHDSRVSVDEFHVEWVGMIHPVASNLAVDAGWLSTATKNERGMTGYSQHFHSIKATAMLVFPDEQDWMSEKTWKALLAAVKELQRTKKQSSKGLTGNSIVNDRYAGIKVRHAMFNRLKDTRKNSKGTSSASCDDEEAYASWPDLCNTPDASIEMERVWKDPAFQPVPIPAYDSDGTLIAAEDYEDKLYGATVHVKAVVVHQYLRFNDTDNFYLDLRYLRIIREPTEITPKDPVASLPAAYAGPSSAGPSTSKRAGSPSLTSGKGKAPRKA